MELTLALGLLCLLVKDTVTGQQTDCACYGNDVTIDSIMSNCSSSDGIIAIDSLYRAVKLTSTGCPNTADSSTRDEANCCTYDSGSDCRIDLTSADVPTVYSDCSGATSCSKQVTWQSTFSDCANNYLSQTNYMCMDYYCIPISDALEFCDTSGTQVTATTSNFYNDGYPASISHFNCCACVITASAASATIDLDILDLQLYEAASSCIQTVFISDNSGVTAYNCSENNDYTIKKLVTSNGDSLTVTLKSDATATGNGKAWFRATVSNGGLTTSCSAVSVCPDEVTTTQSSAAGATDAGQSSGSDAATDSTKETWLFGLSVTVSAIFIAGLFLILLLLFLLCCVICYKWGKSKSFNITNKRTDSRQHLYPGSPKESPVPSDIKPDRETTTTTTGIQSVRSVDIDFPHQHSVSTAASTVSQKSGLFVYRPFENRFTLRSYYRRQSLVRVESP